MFPEGTRSRDGEIGKVRSGAAVIAAQHDIDIVPIYVTAPTPRCRRARTGRKRLPGRFFSRRHSVEVSLRRRRSPRDETERREVMAEVRAFWDDQGPRRAAPGRVEHDVLLMHQVLREYEAAADGRAVARSS